MKGKYFLFSFLSIILLLAFIGCSDDEDSSTNPNNGVPSALVGAWTHDSATVNDTVQTLSEFFEWDQNTAMAQTIIYVDSTYKYEELDAQDSVLYYDEGTITINGQSVTVQTTSENGQSVTPHTTFDGTWAVTGSTLLMTMVDNTDTIKLYFTKQ